MQRVLKFTVLLSLLLIAGCSTYIEDLTVDKLMKEYYFYNPYSINNQEEDKDKIELSGVSISLKDDTILFQNRKKIKNQIKIKLGENERLRIPYISLSADKKYLALELDNSPYYLREIYIITLDELEFQRVSTNKKDVISTRTFVPRWSPNKNILAFASGDIVEAQPALFYLDDNKIKILTTKRFIGILSIKWHKDGESIDYAVEEESDVFAIYRYDLIKNKFYKLINLTREELLLWDQV